MTPDEAKRLLAHAAAFDNRKPSAAAAHAWAAALYNIPLDADTLGAVARYYSLPASDDPNDKRWIQPHHVRFHRAKIREPRIDASRPVYHGQPLETGAESGQSIRALEQAAASGLIPPRTVREAIDTANPRLPLTPRLRAMIAAAGREVPDEDPQQPTTGYNVLGVRCPICHSTIGQACRNGRGVRLVHVHPGRKEDAQRAAEGRPPVDRDQLRREEEHRREAARQLMEANGGPSTFIPPTQAEIDAEEKAAKRRTGAAS